MKFGLIGTGRWGKIYLRTLAAKKNCAIHSVASRDPENARKAIAGLPDTIRVFENWRELVASDCDAVIISGPPALHPVMMDACLDLKKPFIVEKPLCLDLSETIRLDERVRSSGVPVLVDHIHLFNDRYQALKKTISENHEVIRYISSEGMGVGTFRKDASALWDYAPHDLSMCLDLLGIDPEKISFLGGQSHQALMKNEVYSIRLDFPGPTTAWIQSGSLAPQKRRLLSVYTDRRHYLLDDVPPNQKLTVSDYDFAGRYESSQVENNLREILVYPVEPPLSNAVDFFIKNVLHPGREPFGRMGTTLARRIAAVLTACDKASL